MDVSLPSAADLRTLPMRAIVAFAARTARRLATTLRDSVANGLVDNALDLIESVSSTDRVGEVSPAFVASAAASVTAGYSALSDSEKSPERTRAIFAIANASMAAVWVLMAMKAPATGGRALERAVAQAERILKTAGMLEETVKNNILHDFHVLKTEYHYNCIDRDRGSGQEPRISAPDRFLSS